MIKILTTILLMGLLLSFGAKAMEGEQNFEQSKPCKKWKKREPIKHTTCEDLGEHIRRERHHRHVTDTYVTLTKKNLETQIWFTGEESSEDHQIGKIIPPELEDEERWVSLNQDQLQEDGKKRSSMKTDVSKETRPIKSKREERREYTHEITDTNIGKKGQRCIVEWDSSSEEEIPGMGCEQKMTENSF